MLLQKKKSRRTFRAHAALTLLVGDMLALVLAQSPPTYAQKYSDWTTPVNIGPVVNSASNDQQSAISKDGLSLYFTSTRPGGFGAFDLYVGSGVNSTAGDNAPGYFENEAGVPQLYFASNRAGGLGGLDIFVSEQAADGSFGPAVRLKELSSIGADSEPTVRKDGLELVIHSDRPGTTGSHDAFFRLRSSGRLRQHGPVHEYAHEIEGQIRRMRKLIGLSVEGNSSS